MIFTRNLVIEKWLVLVSYNLLLAMLLLDPQLHGVAFPPIGPFGLVCYPTSTITSK